EAASAALKFVEQHTRKSAHEQSHGVLVWAVRFVAEDCSSLLSQRSTPCFFDGSGVSRYSRNSSFAFSKLPSLVKTTARRSLESAYWRFVWRSNSIASKGLRLSIAKVVPSM